MGQAASKAASGAASRAVAAAGRASAAASASASTPSSRAAAAGAGARAGASPSPPRTSSSADAAQAEWNNRRSAAVTSSATSSATSSSSYEGEAYSPNRGEKYRLENEARVASGDSVPEMPPDLIKFLNDSPVLERTVDKELTSSRVYDSLVKDDNARIDQQKEANKRVRRRMPIISDAAAPAEGGVDIDDGSTTERTTNFSTRERPAAPARLGLTREDLFRLSRDLRGLGRDTHTAAWKDAVEREYEGMAANTGGSKNFDQLQDRALFENSLRYIGVPVLMKDSEGDIIGTWQHKADDVKHSYEVAVVPEGSLQFIMLDEAEAEAAAAKES